MTPGQKWKRRLWKINAPENLRLLHNMETDPQMGIGRDARGKNLLGVILEEIRGKGHDMPTPQEDQPKSLSTNHSQSNILVIGDSVLDNIKDHLERVRGDSSVTVNIRIDTQ
jgi:hypothetical protein